MLLQKHLKEFSVMRNLNPQNAGHGIADAIMMSGKKLNPSLTYPCFGSVLAKEKGARSKLPPFIQIGTQVDRVFGGGTAGYLGIRYNPFELPGDPSKKDFTVRDLWQKVRRSFSKVTDLEEVLNLLVDLGYIRQVEVLKREGPGQRPSPRYEVNPKALTQNTQGTQNAVPGDINDSEEV